MSLMGYTFIYNFALDRYRYELIVEKIISIFSSSIIRLGLSLILLAVQLVGIYILSLFYTFFYAETLCNLSFNSSNSIPYLILIAFYGCHTQYHMIH